eukprot:gb/GECG01016194.1/.p1 GENE.gb/GECG01016194.1/~~gb/GECG01016194.1/.p1  ORF type:complete len:112 (+),score=9.45 gb/GECG01016194.1/:1-336(+)
MGVAPSRKELIDITTKSGDSIQLRYTLKGVGKGECNKIYLSKGGDTPLHYAASHGKAQIVRTLIREFGADTDVENIVRQARKTSLMKVTSSLTFICSWGTHPFTMLPRTAM